MQCIAGNIEKNPIIRSNLVIFDFAATFNYCERDFVNLESTLNELFFLSGPVRGIALESEIH